MDGSLSEKLAVAGVPRKKMWRLQVFKQDVSWHESCSLYLPHGFKLPWNLDRPKSPRCAADQRTNQNPTAFNAPTAARFGSVAGWLLLESVVVAERWLFVRGFNVSKFGSNALTALKSRQRKQGNSVQGAG